MKTVKMLSERTRRANDRAARYAGRPSRCCGKPCYVTVAGAVRCPGCERRTMPRAETPAESIYREHQGRQDDGSQPSCFNYVSARQCDSCEATQQARDIADLPEVARH